MKIVYLGKDGFLTFTPPEEEYSQVIGYAEEGQLQLYPHKIESDKEDKRETWRDRPSML